MNLPTRGEIWLADCGMVAKVRPVAVISIPFGDTDRALIMVVPHTTTIIGSEFEIHITTRWLQPGAFNIQAAFPLAPAKFIRPLGTLDRTQLGLIEAGLRHWEGLA